MQFAEKALSIMIAFEIPVRKFWVDFRIGSHVFVIFCVSFNGV
jgi:hypothetical protein